MKKALISVSDKADVITFARELSALGFEIISTGGTKKLLDESGVSTKSIDEFTGFPEILNGRVKTLHPKVHGAILALRDNLNHQKQLMEQDIELIDLVCVNLYPFKNTTDKPNVTFDEAIEQIDIGGPSMLRSAAKNYRYVTAVCDKSDYGRVIDEIKQYGDTLPETKKYLSRKVFQTTAQYDSYIADYLTDDLLPNILTKTYTYEHDLRYGENPHQKAAVYRENNNPYSILNAIILNGKLLSYNNIQDANAAINIIAEFDEPTAVLLKHMNPCGVASTEILLQAYIDAYNCDPVSIFGGIVVVNREIDINLAKVLNQTYLEIIIAPKYTSAALAELKQKKNLRVLQLDTNLKSADKMMMISINGGMLYQEIDLHSLDKNNLKTVTNSIPNEKEIDELLFAWKIVKHVKSNAIVLTKDKKTVGIGAGQMNRIGAAKIALEWAKNQGHIDGLTLASDAFFPFDDVVNIAKTYGVKQIIQPGGSIRDEDSIKACNESNIAMVFTGYRYFKH